MRALALSLAALLAACRFGGEERQPKNQAPVTEEERVRLDSETLSELAALEAALSSYVKTKARAPARLEDLAPDFIPAIPYLELGLPGHPPTDRVEVYPRGVRPAPETLRDTGRWGYAPGPSPAVFVDCTHPDSRGRAWYSEKGAF